MTDHDALYLAVCANPADDTPRLVLADWLDENNQPDRAAFIRAQVEAARAEPFSPKARAAATRADELLARHRLDWTDSFDGLALDVGFARGFVDHAAVKPDVFARTASQLFDRAPIRSLRVVRPVPAEDENPIEPVFEVPQLAGVTRLDLAHVFLQQIEMWHLTRSPHLVALTDLSLARNPIHPPALAEFLASDQLPNLTGLDLSDASHVGAAFADGIERASHRRFIRLTLDGVVFASDALQRMLCAPALKRVEELRFARYPDAERRPFTYLDLGWVLPWGNLRVLDLAGHRLGPAGVREIARNREARTLRWLGLASNELGAEGARELAAAKYLNLYHLDVRDSGLSGHDVADLQSRFPDADVLW